MNFFTFSKRIPTCSYRRKPPYESCCVIFKDRINAPTHTMHYVSVNEIFLENCIFTFFNKQMIIKSSLRQHWIFLEIGWSGSSLIPNSTAVEMALWESVLLNYIRLKKYLNCRTVWNQTIFKVFIFLKNNAFEYISINLWFIFKNYVLSAVKIFA